ncbi:hypothetical protein GCM10010404_43740 [Nonomuraea africana]
MRIQGSVGRLCYIAGIVNLLCDIADVVDLVCHSEEFSDRRKEWKHAKNAFPRLQLIAQDILAGYRLHDSLYVTDDRKTVEDE